MANERSLGLVGVPEGTIEHDLALLERFLEFSAELLRLALIGISAIGFAVAKVVFPEVNERAGFEAFHSLKLILSVALIRSVFAWQLLWLTAITHRTAFHGICKPCAGIVEGMKKI
jgi:hypothetical protein